MATKLKWRPRIGLQFKSMDENLIEYRPWENKQRRIQGIMYLRERGGSHDTIKRWFRDLDI